MAYLKQHPSDIRIKIRQVTAERWRRDGGFGLNGIVDVHLDDDEATWLIDTFDEMVGEIETLRLDVQSARARADQAERSQGDGKRLWGASS